MNKHTILRSVQKKDDRYTVQFYIVRIYVNMLKYEHTAI